MRNFIPFFISIPLLLLSSCHAKDEKMATQPPFSFREIQASKEADIGAPSFFKSNDGVRLAYYSIEAETSPLASLIFLHGGGAYSETGYQNLAVGLRKNYNVSVHLLDLRGHGRSEGPRGDSPSVKQVWIDLKLFIEHIKNKSSAGPLFLGGHSSGGGLILNYDSWNSDKNIEGYFFISPELGYKSKTARSSDASPSSSPTNEAREPFAKVVLYRFILHGMSGGLLFGNSPAVYFNYPESVTRERPLLLKYITCNMSLSMTPNDPRNQFKNIRKPFFLFVGGNDEMFDPNKVVQYAELAKEEIRRESESRIIESENHLSILLTADKLMGDAIRKRASKK